MTQTDGTQTPARGGFGRWVPLIIVMAVLGLFGGYLVATTFFGYQRDVLPSPLVGRPAPETDLPPLREGAAPLTTADLQAEGVKVVNVWASWCGPCRVEHPFLMDLQAAGITLHGINHRDDPANATGFLDELGDPFTLIGVDRNGRASVDWGVYGVPETFVLNGAGEIVYKHVGPIHERDMEAKIWPAIREAQGG
jgi:cytochrome c biogenesis protein CcmG/thiol:disulfide interchange protein DsbE